MAAVVLSSAAASSGTVPHSRPLMPFSMIRSGPGAWRATGGQAAYMASSRLMPKISFWFKFTKASQA